MQEELRKQREMREAIFGHCWKQRKGMESEVSIQLREKMWIQTMRQGYEFAADRVVCQLTALGLKSVEIYGTYGIHCSAYLLNSVQLRELARLIPLVL